MPRRRATDSPSDEMVRVEFHDLGAVRRQNATMRASPRFPPPFDLPPIPSASDLAHLSVPLRWLNRTGSGYFGFFDDLLNFDDRDYPLVDRMAAARRLAARHFVRGVVFHHDRWYGNGGELANAFRQWRGSQDERQAWEDLVVPWLFEFYAERTADDGARLLEDLFDRLCTRLRVNIERELLGRSADGGDPAKRLSEYADTAPDVAELLELAELRVDAGAALCLLRDEDRDMLLRYFVEGADRSTLAAEYGLAPAALRKRIERLVRRISA